jgi:hypothetical protein
MNAFLSLFAAVALVSLLGASSAQASTLGIDEVTSLRSTVHNVLEGSDDVAEAELQGGGGGESTRLAHWLIINETTKWQFDDEVLALEENFFNTEYEASSPQAAAQSESDTLAVFFEVKDAEYKGNAQNATAKK